MKNNFEVNRPFRAELKTVDRFALSDGMCLDRLYLAWVMPGDGDEFHEQAVRVLNESVFNHGNNSPVSMAFTKDGQAAFFGNNHAFAPVLLGMELTRAKGME